MQAPRVSVAISPHFDDAVLSVGGLMSSRLGSRCAMAVVTVCGGIPDTSLDASEWDASAGFRSAAAAGTVRRAEDIAAQRSIGATYTHLPFLDEPYRDQPLTESLQSALSAVTADADEVFVPAAIGGHGDHVMCRDAALSAIDWSNGTAVWLYADLPYAADRPGWGEPGATSLLHASEWAANTRFAVERYRLGRPEAHFVDGAAWDAKLNALMCYRSQVSPLTVEHGAYLSYPGPMQHEMIWPVRRVRH